MSLAETLRFAARAVVGHRLRTGLSLLGVAIGVAAVVVLTALGEGARRYVTAQFASIGTNMLIVVPGRTETTGGVPGFGGVPNDLTLEDARALLRQLPQLDGLAPIAMGTESVAFRERRRRVAIVGSTSEFMRLRHLRVARGQFLPELEMERGASVAVLGDETARELFPGRDPLGQVVRIGAWRMRVIGVLVPRGTQVGMNFDDVVIAPVATVMKMFDRRSLFRVFVKVRSHAELAGACDAVVALVSERHGEEDVTCIRQDAVVQALGSILGVLTLALAAIAAISLSVAGIGIMNVMLVSVSERTAEVGLLRALGAERRQVLGVFLAEAVLLAGSGGLAGLALAWAAIRVLVGLYPDLNAAAPAWAVAAALAVSLAVGALFGVLPARRAARLDPLAALARR